jgi:dipeptidase E
MHITKKIVAMGGGHVVDIYRHAAGLTGKNEPKLLVIPTANYDSSMTVAQTILSFGLSVSPNSEELKLIAGKDEPAEIERKILSADIIYVTGGNTQMAVEIWRKTGVDRLLRQAWEKGTVMSGLSAGAICWFESGHSDSEWYGKKSDWKYIEVEAMGFMKGMFCPHYDSRTALGPMRWQDLRLMMQNMPEGKVCIAVDDYAAIEIIDDHYRILDDGIANAYRVYKQGGIVKERPLPVGEDYKPYLSIFEI